MADVSRSVLPLILIAMLVSFPIAMGGCGVTEPSTPDGEGEPLPPEGDEVLDLTPEERTGDTTLEDDIFEVTLAMADTSTRVVEVTNYEIYTGDVPLARSFFRVYRRVSREVEGALQLPEDLELVEVDIDDSEAVDGHGRRWVMRFDETLAEMEGESREAFLLALARTVIEGNPFRRDPPNFTGIRFFAGEEEIEIDYSPAFQ